MLDGTVQKVYVYSTISNLLQIKVRDTERYMVHRDVNISGIHGEVYTGIHTEL